MLMLNDRETATVLAALRYFQRCGYVDSEIALNRAEIDDLCERLNTGANAVLVAIHTRQDGEDSYLVGSAIPPVDANPSLDYGLKELWEEWQEQEPLGNGNEFIRWLCEEKGWKNLDNIGSIDSVIIDV